MDMAEITNNIAPTVSQDDKIRFLRLQDHNPATDPDGNTALHLAVLDGHVSILELLFEANPALDPAPANSSGDTPLHLAARHGHINCFDYLYSRKRDVPKSRNGWLPIHEAASNGHTSMVDYFADRPNVTARTDTGVLPVHYAALAGHLDVVKRLTELGRDFGISIDGRSEKPTTLEHKELYNRVRTPLYLATSNGHRSTAKYLISQKADINVDDLVEGRTLLHECARNGFSDIFQTLLDRGLDPFQRTKLGATPMVYAVANSWAEIVEIYLKIWDTSRGSTLISNDDEVTLLSSAINAQNIDIATTLILHGIGIMDSSLTYAVTAKDVSVLTLLLDHEVDVKYADELGSTALHYAAGWDNLPACKLLIRRGVDKNVVNKYGQTPLMKAAERFHTGSVRYLLDIGAELSGYDSSGLSVFDYCETFAPIMDMLQPFIIHGTLLSPEERKSRCMTTIRNLLEKLERTGLTSPNFNTEPFDQLRLCFFRVKDYDAARVCYERSFLKTGNGETLPNYWCDMCRKIWVPGSFWVCKTCSNTGVCSPCYKKHGAGNPAQGCSMVHEYLELGGESWRKLEKGKVNSHGQTMKEWISEQVERYGVDGPATIVVGKEETRISPNEAHVLKRRFDADIPYDAATLNHSEYDEKSICTEKTYGAPSFDAYDYDEKSVSGRSKQDLLETGQYRRQDVSGQTGLLGWLRDRRWRRSG